MKKLTSKQKQILIHNVFKNVWQNYTEDKPKYYKVIATDTFALPDQFLIKIYKAKYKVYKDICVIKKVYVDFWEFMWTHNKLTLRK